MAYGHDKPAKLADAMSGFQTSGYIDKKGAPTGDMGFNVMPPGMFIGDQPNCDLAGPDDNGDMIKRELTPLGYPESGGYGTTWSTVKGSKTPM